MPEGEEDVKHLNLKVSGQDGAVLHFKIKKSTNLKKLMSTFCERQKLDPQTVRFMFDGTRVDDNDTPNSLGMEEGDCIDALVEQTGGFYCCIQN